MMVMVYELMLSNAMQVEGQAAGTGEARASAGEGGGSRVLAEQNDGRGTYTLQAIISHIGRNTEHGHYVCHVKKGDRWIFFNDDKVAISQKPPFEHGFMYMFKRDDNDGSI
jgi:ubiquitin carboxyl-terminal hydrolase 5/13